MGVRWMELFELPKYRGKAPKNMECSQQKAPLNKNGDWISKLIWSTHSNQQTRLVFNQGYE